jgi:glutathione S-transferase
VFRTFEEFRQINPVVKAPSLVCDDGTVLMDSTLILEYAESLAAPGKSLMPAKIPDRQYALRIIGLALAACEKSVQIVYERNLRPAEKQHEPWMSRITGQLLAALAALEAALSTKPLSSERIDQAGITTAITWHFAQAMVPDVIPANDFPTLRAFSVRAEQLPAFAAAPHGAGTVRRAS